MQAILSDRREWGVSCHRIDAEFDTGHLLASEHFPLTADEWHEWAIDDTADRSPSDINGGIGCGSR
jgi:methionyl-tRNA formyltransferase